MKTRLIAFGLFGCNVLLRVIAYAADPSASGTPPPLGQPTVTNLPPLRFTEWPRALHERALQAGDQEVAAAAEYNLLHLAAVGTNDTEAKAALLKLAELGDEFTLAWLERHPPRTTSPERSALAQKTQEQIRHRVQTTPSAPEKLVYPRLLRTAVADLTCNALEVELKGFAWDWIRRQATNDAVRAELRQLARPGSAATLPLSPQHVRERASSYTDSLLNPPKRPAK
jgi:hypothetical protein